MRASTKLISQTHPTLHLAHPTIESFIWNTLIRAHIQSYKAQIKTHSPLSIFLRMRFHGVKPDLHTFPFLLQFFTAPPHLPSTRQTHTLVILFGLDNDPFVQTSLINAYSSCGSMLHARKLFDEIPQPDLPSWNSIVNANIKARLIENARRLFDRMPERNVISWSCMINGYVQCECYKEALALFCEMQVVQAVRPNGFTISSVLSACGHLGALEQGKWVHAYIEKHGMKIDVVLGTSLVDMYAKCGSIERSKWVFDNIIFDKDVMAYSAMISGLATHGYANESLELFYKMIAFGLRPNVVTFMGVLCACVHGGLVNEGKEWFRKMREEFGLVPEIQHYGCLVDLLGRAGLIKEAWKVVESMPLEPDVLIWGALLSGARMSNDIETCEIALEKLLELDCENSGAYVLLSNVYAKMGKWTEVMKIRNVMGSKGIKKVPGVSLIELEGGLHEFFAGDESREETKEIYFMLDEIMRRLRLRGFVGNTREVLLDLDEEGRELALNFHSEKLAIAFCILKTSVGTPIRIVMNLRICGDCHEFMKIVSTEFEREIVVRDCNRFHHFRDGSCSCKDVW